MVDAQTVGVLVTAASVTVAAIYYVLNLRISQRNQELSLKTQELALKSQQQNLETRQSQILMSLYQKWIEPEFQDWWFDIQEWEWRDYDDFMEKYGRKSNPDAWRKFVVLGSFLEGLGVFVKRGLIDALMVDDLLSWYIVVYWQKLGSIYIEYRRRMNSPTIMEFGEYLYDVVYEIWNRQHPETTKPGPISAAGSSPPSRG
jgi:hypothetical protein